MLGTPRTSGPVAVLSTGTQDSIDVEWLRGHFDTSKEDVLRRSVHGNSSSVILVHSFQPQVAIESDFPNVPTYESITCAPLDTFSEYESDILIISRGFQETYVASDKMSRCSNLSIVLIACAAQTLIFS